MAVKPIEVQVPLALEAEPTAPSHAVNVTWVEQFFLGRVKLPVRLVATNNLAGTYAAGIHRLTLSATGHLHIDGEAVAVNDRVLLVGQTTAIHNGIYVVEVTGNGGAAELVRAPDFNASNLIYPGVTVSVREGSQHETTTWKLVTEGTIVLDSTALEFTLLTRLAAAAKYAEDIVGDNTETEFEITHNLGTTDVSVAIRNLVSNAVVLTDVNVDDGNNVTIGFAEPPTPAEHYRVVVMG